MMNDEKTTGKMINILDRTRLFALRNIRLTHPCHDAPRPG